MSGSNITASDLPGLYKERMLRFWLLMRSLPVEVKTIDDGEVTGIFEGTNSTTSHILLSNMQTPSFFYEQAKLRTEEISHISSSHKKHK